MKIRIGFVSNSSTASFIVRIKNTKLKDPDFLVNKEDIPKLEEYGFTKSNITNPFDQRNIMSKSENPDNYISMKYYTSCNYDFVICFLIKNNIPFEASCHYHHKLMSYKKDSNYILEAINYGRIISTYGESFYNSKNTKDLYPFRKILKNEYLEMYDD